VAQCQVHLEVTMWHISVKVSTKATLSVSMKCDKYGVCVLSITSTGHSFTPNHTRHIPISIGGELV